MDKTFLGNGGIGAKIVRDLCGIRDRGAKKCGMAGSGPPEPPSPLRESLCTSEPRTTNLPILGTGITARIGIKEVFSTNYISIVEKTINSIQSEDIRVEKEA